MPTILTTKAVEKSTYIINASFTDEDGSPEIPKAGLKWTLTDDAGGIVNGREDVIVAVPAASIDIVLHGDDLAVTTTGANTRILTIEGTYDSALGADLEIYDECTFGITNLTQIT